MDFRKLISFGKNSFVVSMPKAWVNKFNLKKVGSKKLKGRKAETMIYEVLD